MINDEASYEIKNSTLTIKPFGDIDHDKTVRLRQCADELIEKYIIKNIVFDFDKVDFLDSAGIGFIMGRYRKIYHEGGKIRAVNVKPYVGRILRYSGLHQIMEIEDREG